MIPSKKRGAATNQIYDAFANTLKGPVRLVQLSDYLVELSEYEYRESDLLGMGGSGRVYKARLKGKDQMVALKIVQNKLSSTDQEAFLREVEVQAQLRHPAVHPVLGFSLVTSDNKGPAILTPLMATKSLEGMLVLDQTQAQASGNAVKRRNPTTLSKSVFGVAAALEYLHSMGVVHGDLKPDNVFFDRNFNPVLGDFGRSQYVVATLGSPAVQRPPGSPTVLHGFDLDINMFASFLIQIYNRFPFENTPKFVTKLMKRCGSQDENGVPVEGLRPPMSQVVDELLESKEWVFEGANTQKLQEYQEKLKQYRPGNRGSSEMSSSAGKEGSESVEAVDPDQKSAKDAPMLGIILGGAAGGVVALVIVVVVIRRRAAKKDEEHHEAPEMQA